MGSKGGQGESKDRWLDRWIAICVIAILLAVIVSPNRYRIYEWFKGVSQTDFDVETEALRKAIADRDTDAITKSRIKLIKKLYSDGTLNRVDYEVLTHGVYYKGQYDRKGGYYFNDMGKLIDVMLHKLNIEDKEKQDLILNTLFPEQEK